MTTPGPRSRPVGAGRARAQAAAAAARPGGQARVLAPGPPGPGRCRSVPPAGCKFKSSCPRLQVQVAPGPGPAARPRQHEFLLRWPGKSPSVMVVQARAPGRVLVYCQSLDRVIWAYRTAPRPRRQAHWHSGWHGMVHWQDYLLGSLRLSYQPAGSVVPAAGSCRLEPTVTVPVTDSNFGPGPRPGPAKRSASLYYTVLVSAP